MAPASKEARSVTNKPSSDFTLQKRERSLRACTRCRQRKQRCDNALPHCSNCIKGGVPCEAFPINVVSKENLLKLYDQLQDTGRQAQRLQDELDKARPALPDRLQALSLALLRRLSEQLRLEAASGSPVSAAASNSAASSTEPLVMPALPYALRLRLERICFGVQHLQHLHHARTAAGSSSQQQGRDKVKTNVGNEREATSARQGVLDFVSIAFPALYVPVRDVFSSFKTEAVIASSAAGDHASAASALSTVMDLLARGQILRNNHAWPAKESFDVLDEANTLADEIFRAPVNTRLAAVCLLATAALSAFRLPELQRLEAVIAFSFWSAHSIQADWLRAAHWLQLEVSLLCGAACGGWTGVEPALSSPDAGSTVVHLQSQLVYQHHQQKRLEYGIQQAFSSEVLLYESCSFDGSHGEAIWHLVREIWSLAQTVETEIERDRNTPSPISLHVHVALLRYKLLIQIYSSFPRQLLLSIVSDEHKFAWIDTAQTMALRALSLYHLCAAQFGWLGDSYLDAHRFAELLVSFAFCLQKSIGTLTPASELFVTCHVAVDVSLKMMKRWSLCSTSLVEATNFLSRLKDAGLSCSNSSSGSNGGTAGVGDRSHGMEIPRPGDNGMAPVVGAFTGAGLATAGGPPEHGFQVLPSTVIDYQHREGGSNVGSSDFGCSSTSNGNSNSNSTSPGQDVFQKASTMPLHLPLPLSTHMPPLQFQFNHALMQGDSNANGNPHALATSTSTMPTDWSHPLSSGVHLNPASSVPNSTSTSASTTNLEPIHPSINGCQSESMHMPSQLPLSQPWSTTNCFHRPIFLYSTDADDAQAQAQQNGHHDESTKA